MSPRIVTIIIFEEYPSSNNTPYPIVGLASVYLAGCAHKSATVNSVNDLNRYCTNPSTMDIGDLSGLFVSAPGLAPVPIPNACHRAGHVTPQCPATPTPTPSPGTPTPTPGPATPTPTSAPTPTPTQPPVGPPGHIEVWGNLFNLVVAGGSGGPGGESSTSLGIYLVE
jgi:hypothetical protein